MRLLYFILYFTLKYSLFIFYPRKKSVNTSKEFFGRTIYVSNHAASFMDPLVVASTRRPIVFFMTRSDVFKWYSNPILWMSHMLPIYRQHDGVDTKAQNDKVFDKCNKVLSFGRNLLIFGEGFTDDVFIRRLKPVKKGAARIGFAACEYTNWEKKIYIAAVGCNYSQPNLIGSDVLISDSDKFCLNDYKAEYEKNPNRAITIVTQRLEKLMKAQITHVENKNWTHFHEHVMEITRKGMNALHSDRTIPLEKRWKYSQGLANWLNEQPEEKLEQLEPLKKELSIYFGLENRMHVNDEYVYELETTGKISRTKEFVNLFLLFPLGLLGMLHCAIPYFAIKRFVEKSFKRKVFWGSVKLILGMIVMGLINIPFIFLFHNYIFPSYLLGFLYYAGIGVYGASAYWWFKNLKTFKEKGYFQKMDLSKFLTKRKELERRIKEQIPVA